MKRPWVYVGFLLLSCSLEAGYCADGVVIRLPEKATVVGPEITLGEIAEVIGNERTVEDRLRRLTLGRAAPVGDKVKMTLASVKIALRREGYSLEGFAFGGADAVEVLTSSQSLDSADLLPQVKAFVAGQTSESPDNIEVKMEGTGKKILLPAGAVSAQFRPSFSGRYEGPVLLTAELKVDGRQVRVLPLRVEVEITRPAVTASRRIGKDEKFTNENVSLVRTPGSKLLRGCFGRLDAVLGHTAALPILAGSVIRLEDIYDPPVIRHGQVVQGVVEKGSIELSVEVRAIEDAKVGDSIQVENTESHKLLRGKVLDEKTVLIEPETTR